MTRTSSEIANTWPRRQFRAPAESGGLLVEPHSRTPLALLTSNRQVLDAESTLIGKEALAAFRRAARRDILRNACEYTARLRDVRPEMPSIDADLVVVGHQPGLFHPGVWLKHWAAGAIARHADGVALNVVVDNDLCDSVDVTLPTSTGNSLQTTRVALDHDFSRRPWEDVRIQSPSQFRSAGERLCQAMENEGFEPLACHAWEQITQVDANDSLVDHLTRIRHREQMHAGVDLLEVPMRNIARLPSFAQFVAHIVQNIASLSAVYNEGLAIYRRLNRLRSDSHPMPDLARLDGLYEVPLWVWRAGETQRRPLWVRPDGCGTKLFDRAEPEASPIAVVRDGDCEWDVWHRMLTDLDHQGYRVRPRALMTTLFLRLCVADLFVHGIGGAKYDEVTDWIIRQFIGLRPPEFLTVSGTYRLPLDRHDVAESTVQQLRRTLRDMKYNPDRHGATGPLVDEKEALVAEQKEAANRNGEPRANRQRYQRLREIADELFKQIEPRFRETQHDLSEAQAALRSNRIANGREYSWVLFEKNRLLSDLDTAASAIAVGTF